MQETTGLGEGKWLKVREVATALRLSNMTIYRLVRDGKLPAIRVGRSYRIPEAAAREYLAAAGAQPQSGGVGGNEAQGGVRGDRSDEVLKG